MVFLFIINLNNSLYDMFNKLRVIILLSVFLFSCKENKNISDEILTLDVDFVALHDDSLHVFYTETNSIDFSSKGEFWFKIKGENKNQRIKIDFPKAKQPKNVRIDFGNNKKNEKIILNKLKFKFQKNFFELKGNEIYYYFYADENNTNIDKKNGILTRKIKNVNKGPSLYPKKPKLYNKLKNIYNKND